MVGEKIQYWFSRKRFAVYNSVAAAPISCIIVSPDTASPVQSIEIGFRLYTYKYFDKMNNQQRENVRKQLKSNEKTVTIGTSDKKAEDAYET